MVTQLRALLLGVLMVISAQAFAHKEDKNVRGLNDVTVLIVRHAEKPDEGPLLSPKGEQRAAAYASYFDPLLLNGICVVPQRLIATSDSKQSFRPRLTLTPLAQRLQLPLETPYADNEVGKLVKSLRKSNQAQTVLIAWHHGHIDKLIEAFGGDGQALTGMQKWPENVYDWLIVLRFDEQGQLVESHSQKVQEHLLPGDIAAANGS
ncbi:flagellar basal body-associated protein FliL [Pseudomonas sp. Bout1]|uniref:flagellar basal body-associated protein FliL n=1 Tax=Pseudomonas sp. Bout1 TaxID=3048600 RepID=UPI002AB4D5CB|nr:flagellar basal body-associated protein FliL [Pseudomonas sp. Bout1]MDY7536081.1 flagellar basal body-associated protein FliL [Pseudomonas sp. Bout1]MEB0183284.1 flagellar basal body-associated protein FliL [Pseudomonas sp. Bout1]